MRPTLSRFVLAFAWLAFAASTGAFQEATARLRIDAPTAEAILVGRSEVVVRLDVPPADVRSVQMFVDGKLLCTRTQPPWSCPFDGGVTPTSHHVRVVARVGESDRLVASVRTRALGFTEAVRVDAVQVPVIVRDGDGRFVGGLRAEHFAIRENGVPQTLTQVSSESVPLDVVLAIDISGSMGEVMGEVIRAAAAFLDRLRPEDAATVLAFNDNRFVVADGEKDPVKRRAALAGLQPWGGTALYDAIGEALDLAARGSGRKGIVVFSDGEDQASRVTSGSAIRRIQQSDAMVYTIAFGSGASQPGLRKQLEVYAKASGGRVFFPRDAEDLARAFGEIIDELSSQYLLSYEPKAGVTGWRTLEVDLVGRQGRVRARDGYMAAAR